jgi:hypothetical protein
MIHAFLLTFTLDIVKYYSISIYLRHIHLGRDIKMDGGREMERKGSV